MSAGLLTIVRMAVQPDHRPAESIAAESGMDLVVMAQSGPYVMCRFRAHPNADSFYLRDTRPRTRLREGVWRLPCYRWAASGFGDDVSFATALEAFEAWVAAQG